MLTKRSSLARRKYDIEELAFLTRVEVEELERMARGMSIELRPGRFRNRGDRFLKRRDAERVLSEFVFDPHRPYNYRLELTCIVLFS